MTREADYINAYLIAGADVIIGKCALPAGGLHEMIRGNAPVDGGYLLLTKVEVQQLGLNASQREKFIRRFMVQKNSSKASRAIACGLTM